MDSSSVGIGKTIALWLAILAVVAGGAWYVFSKQVAPLDFIERSIQAQTKTYSVDALYPEFAGEVATAVNTALANLLDATVKEFIAAAEEVPEPVRFGQPGLLTVRYGVTASTTQLVSVRFTISAMQAGTAHPNNYILGFTYDVIAGRSVRLKEVFRADVAPLPVIVEFVRPILAAQLKERGVVGWLDEGLALREENYSRFIVSPEGILFFFNPYQIAPYAAGEFEVLVPWDKLREIIEPALLPETWTAGPK